MSEGHQGLIAQVNAVPPMPAPPTEVPGSGLIVVLFLVALVIFGGVLAIAWLLVNTIIRVVYPQPIKKCPHCGKDLAD
jgi:hypothetical protein